MTVAARDAIQRADLVIADRICSPAILDLVEGELRVARKYPGRAAEAQAELNRWVLEGVRAGKRVVRLKCGDPFVFGRGGEELRFLAERGVTADVIPGVSSALAAPMAAGIPVTHRGLANRVTVMTAVARGGAPLRPPAFDPDATVVVLMGVRRLPDLVQEMLAAGYPASLPVAIVERGTWSAQRTTTATLATVVQTAAEAGVAAPATIVVGEVAAFPASLALPLLSQAS
jgi:uroporphyrin-III C-methyltransferase